MALIPGTAYWFDFAVQDVTTSNVSLSINSGLSSLLEIGGANLLGGPTGPTGAGAFTGPTGPAGAGPTGYNTGGTFQAAGLIMTGTTSTTVPAMLGLGTTFTPSNTGKILLEIEGSCYNEAGTVATSGLFLGVRYGPTGGAPPTNRSALTGLAVGPTLRIEAGATITVADWSVPFHMSRLISGLTIGQNYWFDLTTLAIVNSAAIIVLNPNTVIVELP